MTNRSESREHERTDLPADEHTDGEPADEQTDGNPADAEPSEDDDSDHLADVEDGAGCTEIWEHLSERREAER